MKNRIQTILLTSLFIAVFLLLSFSGNANAGCRERAYCDAPPGECGPTCNGGQSCIIANGWYQTTCETSQHCDPCTDGPGICSEYPTPADCYDICSPPGSQVYTCIETVVSNCCSPGGGTNSCGDGVCNGTETCSSCESDCQACPEYCGDGTCNNGELCSTCATDCGSCEYCGDNFCGGGEDCNNCGADCGSCAGPSCGNGSCEAGEWCGNCSADCGSCTSCGDGICNGSENCSSCRTDCGSCTSCGDGVCSADENCNSCALDCGSCAAPAFCGDETCDADESCATCEADCQACAENEAWFQVSGGHIGSDNTGGSSVAIQSKITDEISCVAPNCVRSLLSEDQSSTAETDGFAVAGSGIIDANGYLNERGPTIASSNTNKTRYNERYEFFYRNSGLGLSPTNDFSGSETDIQKPTYNANKIAYFQSGDVTLQSPWSVASGESYVIFIDGNLTLADGDGLSDQLIDVAPGGFLGFIVSGDITIASSLGNVTLTNTTPNVEGVFIADGEFTIESKGTAAGGDDRIVLEGSYIGWSGVSLNRDFSDGGSRSSENNDKPVEIFIYRPDFVVNMPDILLVPIRIWQETN